MTQHTVSAHPLLRMGDASAVSPCGDYRTCLPRRDTVHTVWYGKGAVGGRFFPLLSEGSIGPPPVEGGRDAPPHLGEGHQRGEAKGRQRAAGAAAVADGAACLAYGKRAARETRVAWR